MGAQECTVSAGNLSHWHTLSSHLSYREGHYHGSKTQEFQTPVQSRSGLDYFYFRPPTVVVYQHMEAVLASHRPLEISTTVLPGRIWHLSLSHWSGVVHLHSRSTEVAGVNIVPDV